MLIKFNYHTTHYFSTENINKNVCCKFKQPQYPIHAELDGYIKLLHNKSDFNILLIYRGLYCNLPSEPCYVCSNWLRRISDLMICYTSKDNQIIVVPSYQLKGHYRKL